VDHFDGQASLIQLYQPMTCEDFIQWTLKPTITRAICSVLNQSCLVNPISTFFYKRKKSLSYDVSHGHISRWFCFRSNCSGFHFFES
jgi:hypothetical protein